MGNSIMLITVLSMYRANHSELKETKIFYAILFTALTIYEYENSQLSDYLTKGLLAQSTLSQLQQLPYILAFSCLFTSQC